jgi:chromosomal replication initiator protein
LEFWNKCSERLENKLSQDDYNTWIRPLKGSLVKNTLELVAPNDFILNYVEKNLAEEITSLVKQQSKKDISLVYKTLTKETFVDKYQETIKTKTLNL